MSKFYGVKYSQQPSALIAPASVDGSLPMAFGCAPIHRLDPEQQAKAMPGNIVLCFSDAEASANLGIRAARDDFKKWGLSEQAFCQFHLYGKSPGIFVNVFNPNVHNVSVVDELVTFIGGEALLANEDVIGDVTLTNASATTYAVNVDYTINKISGAITVIADSSLAAALATTAAPIRASYTYAAPELVTPEDVIGGYDAATGITTGLELVEHAFPRFRMVPGILIAPNFSQDATVAMIMAAKCVGINGIFGAIAYADLPVDDVKLYTDVPEYKNKNGLTSENLVVHWPQVRVGDRVMNLATHAAGVTAAEDRARNGIPYSSPSNKNIQCQATVGVDGEEISLSLPQANFLRGNGIVTVLNFAQGNVLWGANTAAYPGNTDPTDQFTSSRRMIAWYGNKLILTWFQKVDDPANRRLLETIVNSEQISLNSLVAAGALLGGTISFIPEANSLLDLMDGQIVFDISLGLVSPAQHIHFRLQYEPAFLETLFG